MTDTKVSLQSNKKSRQSEISEVDRSKQNFILKNEFKLNSETGFYEKSDAKTNVKITLISSW